MRVNIYIRKEDEDKWNAIDNKAEWLHFHLNKGVKVVMLREDGSGKIEDHYNRPEKKSPLPDGKKTIQFDSTPVGENLFHKLTTDEVSSRVTPVITPDEFEEAFDAAEQDCCRKKAPCKHWQFINGMWINSLSGRSREVEE